ncbi:MAG: hypothetical protein OXM87_00170 [Truepera sp.]|nr:hypothetical protein [Truepera sp.]
MKTAKRRRSLVSVIAALAGIIILSLAATATAESGTFRSIVTQLHDYTSFEFADQTITGGAAQGVVTIIEGSGGPFVVGEHSRITCIAYAKQSDAGLEIESPCVTINAMGDKQFWLAQRTLGDIGGAGQGGGGSAQLLGGTGQFAGITGTCSYEAEYLEDNWLVSMLECEWERP